MVKPLGEAKDVREFFPELAKKIGGGMEEWYQEDVEEYMEQWAKAVPENPKTGKSGLDRLKEEGAWEDESRDPFYDRDHDGWQSRSRFQNAKPQV